MSTVVRWAWPVENLIRNSRRQRALHTVDVPDVCLLDGDTIRRLSETGRATRLTDLACYHSELGPSRNGGDEAAAH